MLADAGRNHVQVRRRREQHPRAIGQRRTRQHALGAGQRPGRLHALGVRGPLSHGLPPSLGHEPRRHTADDSVRQPDQPRHDPGPQAGSAQPEAGRDVVARPRDARALRQDRAGRSTARTGRSPRGSVHQQGQHPLRSVGLLGKPFPGRQQDGHRIDERPGRDGSPVPLAGGTGQSGILDRRTAAGDEARAGAGDRRPHVPGRRPWMPGPGQPVQRPQDEGRPAGHGQAPADLRGAAQADQLCRRDVRNVRRRHVLGGAVDRVRPGFRRRQRLFQAAAAAQLSVRGHERKRALRQTHALVHVRHARRNHHLRRLP